MTRWRVDYEVKSDVVLAKDNGKVVFTAPDNSHEIHLITKRGQGKHAADELYLSAHVILNDESPTVAGDRADGYLHRFLDTLAIVSSTYYRIRRKVFVADWSPGLKMRRILYFKEFPNPNVPIYGLRQEIIETVKVLMTHPIPEAVHLAMRWWARGVSVERSHEQFQLFWYALEILAEYRKPSVKISSKCPVCQNDLFCNSCKCVPTHRPYPKQAIKMLIEKHVTQDPSGFFELIDEARNSLLHGDDPEKIEQTLSIEWNNLSDSLGKATWVALITTLRDIRAEKLDEGQKLKLELLQTNTFTHYHATLTTDASFGAQHADPENPQIEEFEPEFEINMIVNEPSQQK